MANIFDVAQEAGVSHQTVSRVVNGDPNVRPATRQRVDDAIAKLNYRPSAAARALASRKTRALGLISTGGPLFGPSSIMQGFDGAAREAGYQVSIASINRPETVALRESMRSAVDALLGQNVEAIVLIAPDSRAIDAIGELAVPVPLVTADAGDHAGLVSVSLDQFSGAVLAAEHLASLGHRAILHVAGPSDWNDAVERERGFQAAAQRLGLAPLPSVRGDWSPESGYRLGADLADRVEAGELTAIFSSNDQMALGLLHAFAERGVRVPEQVSIVGFDDVPEAAHFYPPLTTVRQDFGALGRQIMRTVEAQLAGPSAEPAASAPPESDPTAPQLVVRASTASAPR
ncbi:substrate-binding domain-containing protein [Frondihabitans australicus]|uniref:LacI family transcriptional regulator n=1 Tax=Frondihabitans australicus TaxID=386892 RepID=A0A495IAA9_9MICO|nr:substrate-binding domain-containing protein [Frondihabitans australicus]RKR72947.1 LacI family transcriptional regulator [Frondihabitans australicus]